MLTIPCYGIPEQRVEQDATDADPKPLALEVYE
jgi:hypothetical protein